MTKLAYLHEPGVLYNLASRFALNEIYVSSVHPIDREFSAEYQRNHKKILWDM